MLEWADALSSLQDKFYLKKAIHFYQEQVLAQKVVYPAKKDLFNAFKLTSLENLKVVILGQDPYINEEQAMGLSFSVPPHIKTPPSLVNIYKELHNDIDGFIIPKHGCLVPWAKQGVFLLNSILSVEQGKSLSHQKQGWEQFTDEIINIINQNKQHVVYMLWGAKAKAKCAKVDREHNLILEAAHPSPLSARNGFFGCKHFSLANAYLQQHNIEPINWQLPEANSAELKCEVTNDKLEQVLQSIMAL